MKCSTDPSANENRSCPFVMLNPSSFPLEISTDHTTFPVTMGEPASKAVVCHATDRLVAFASTSNTPSRQGTNTEKPACAVPP